MCPGVDVLRKERCAWRQTTWCGGGMPLRELGVESISRWMFPSSELFDRTRSCGVLESPTASEMTAP
jgi:hypothetical protein